MCKKLIASTFMLALTCPMVVMAWTEEDCNKAKNKCIELFMSDERRDMCSPFFPEKGEEGTSSFNKYYNPEFAGGGYRSTGYWACAAARKNSVLICFSANEACEANAK